MDAETRTSIPRRLRRRKVEGDRPLGDRTAGVAHATPRASRASAVARGSAGRPRRSAQVLSIVSIASAAASSVLLAPGAHGNDLRLWLASSAPDGTTVLRYDDPAAGSVLGPEVAAGRWLEWGLRSPHAAAPDGPRPVREATLPLPFLELASGPRLIALDAGEEAICGVLALGPRGLRSVISSPGPFRLAEQGVASSPSGSILALIGGVPGREAVWTIGVDGSTPTAVAVPVAGDLEIAPSSLTLTDQALFLAARPPEGEWRVYRQRLAAPLEARPGDVEEIAGPFAELHGHFAASPAAVAFVAGAAADAMNVFTATSSGAARRRTPAPLAVAESRPGALRLAVSRDGRHVAFNSAAGGVSPSSELFLSTAVEGEEAEPLVHVTAEERFARYIEQDVLIFFDASGGLVFAAGHATEESDLFRLDPTRPGDVVNLTRTGGSVEPPFTTKGTLRIERAVELPGDRLLVIAEGFGAPGELGVRLVDLPSVEEVVRLDGLLDVGAVFSVGAEGYLVTRGSDGRRRLHRVGDAELETLLRTEEGQRMRLIAGDRDRALVLADGAGVVDLSAGRPARLLPAPIDPEGDPIVATPLSADEGRASLIWASGGALRSYLELDLASGSLRKLLEAPGAASPVGRGLRSAPFLRGDSDADGTLGLADAVAVLEFLFRGARAPDCLDAADADDSGRVDLTDPVRVLGHLFLGAPPPPPPFPSRGLDEGADLLDCAAASS